MITLPPVKVWTGDGYGATDARILTQVKRTEKVALYHRTVKRTGTSEGYELFFIKMRHQGDPLPGNTFEKEDREVYPSAGSFGKTAWHHHNLAYAEKRFEELANPQVKLELVEDESEATVETPEESSHSEVISGAAPVVLKMPEGEFTTKELAAFNNVEYSVAFLWLKTVVSIKQVKVVGQRKVLGQRGKPAVTYAKA